MLIAKANIQNAEYVEFTFVASELYFVDDVPGAVCSYGIYVFDGVPLSITNNWSFD